MSKKLATTSGVNYGILRLFIVFLAVFAFFLGFSQTVYADTTDCFRSVKKNRQVDGKEYTVLVFNTTQKCDLYRTIRWFPQLNTETQEPLSDQEQLRSIYAANQKVKVGDRELATVLRGCVPNSKPWPDQTADERDFCSGLVNYYQNGFGGPVLIPHTRQLSRGEKLESAFFKACAIINAQPNTSEQEKEVLNDCQQLITGFVITSLADKAVEIAVEKNASFSSESKEDSDVYLKQINGLKNQIATLETKTQKGVWFWPLFSLMVGFAIFGTFGIIFGIKERRDREITEMRHKLFIQDSREIAIQSKDSFASRSDIEERSSKIEKRMREEFEMRFVKLVKNERIDLERQVEAKYDGMTKKLAKQVAVLEKSLEKITTENMRQKEKFDVELKMMTDERDGENAKVININYEIQVLKKLYEEKCNQTTALNTRVANLLAAEECRFSMVAFSVSERKTLPVGLNTETMNAIHGDSMYSMIANEGDHNDAEFKNNITSSTSALIKPEHDEDEVG